MKPKMRYESRGIPIVAPYAGAWIETAFMLKLIRVPPESLPTRERGLKRQYDYDKPEKSDVAPYAGAWIETARYRY